MAVDSQDGGGRPSAARWWYDPKVRAIAFQVAFVLTLIGLGVYLIHNTIINLEKRNIKAGFDFLNNPAGFEIPLTLIPYSVEAGSTHGAVFIVGLLNTLLISVLGIVLATILGFILGVLRLSNNWLVSRLVGVYIESVRNVPLLLQFLFWHFAVFQTLPLVRRAIPIFDTIYIHNRGLTVPKPIPQPGFMVVVISVFLAVAAVGLSQKMGAQAPGRDRGAVPRVLGVARRTDRRAAARLGCDRFSADLGIRRTGPVRLHERPRNPDRVVRFAGRAHGLHVFVHRRNRPRRHSRRLARPAGSRLFAGVRPGPTLKLVIIPQALRVIVPPLVSQYLNLMKNSSLGIATAIPICSTSSAESR